MTDKIATYAAEALAVARDGETARQAFVAANEAQRKATKACRYTFARLFRALAVRSYEVLADTGWAGPRIAEHMDLEDWEVAEVLDAGAHFLEVKRADGAVLNVHFVLDKGVDAAAVLTLPHFHVRCSLQVSVTADGTGMSKSRNFSCPIDDTASTLLAEVTKLMT